MERIKDFVRGDPLQQRCGRLNRLKSDSMTQVNRVDPSTQCTADAAIAIEQEHVFVGRHTRIPQPAVRLKLHVPIERILIASPPLSPAGCA